jgi:hypothetical protein
MWQKLFKLKEITWYTPEALAQIGFNRSRVVMMNEAHHGWLRCIRTREIGIRILPTAHRAGVRHLAMEALTPAMAEEVNRTRRLPRPGEGYLLQPEMRELVQIALDLGWTLIAYEADLAAQPAQLSPTDAVNWRDEQQARNLIHTLQALPPDTHLLVWCGNSHHRKRPMRDTHLKELLLMGYQFWRLSNIDPFVIDQTPTVDFGHASPECERLVERFRSELEARDGTAGFLEADAPRSSLLNGADAFILSTQNALE